MSEEKEMRGNSPETDPWLLCKKQADEIERLWADNKQLQEELDRCRAFYEAWMTARYALGNER